VARQAAGRLFAIGDVHGCARELELLLGALTLKPNDVLLYVGDYIDRGPDSRAVIDLVLACRRETAAQTVCLKGNHEDMALAHLGRPGHWGEAWMRNGGNVALESYGIDPELPGAEVAERLPPSHLAFLEELASHHRWRDYLFVHAGIRPEVRWEEQRPEDLLWIREEFLDHPHGLDETVIFGHTPHRRVVVDLPYKIGIDTGCIYGGALTCLELPAGTLYQVPLGASRVYRDTIALRRRRPA
jgi:serine/threonine protein phosphatase 1